MAQRESPGERGYFLLLISPSDGDTAKPAPRDLVLVLDTSSSMDTEKLRQAKAALKHTLSSLKPYDRFALVSFASTPVSFREELAPAAEDDLLAAGTWVDKLEAGGGTDISAALEAALAIRGDQPSDRTFQIVFLTDGLPTVGLKETPEILKILDRRDRRGIRIYTFGVGDDVDAHLLDLLAEKTSACSTYVRPGEDIEAKVSAFSRKIGRPARTDLKLAISGGTHLVEMFPPAFPTSSRASSSRSPGVTKATGLQPSHSKAVPETSASRKSSEPTSPRQPPTTASSPRSGPAQGRLSPRSGALEW